MSDDHVRIVVSGSGWMGSGSGSIETALHQLFTRANNEVLIVAYTISGSITAFFQQISTLLQRGIKVTILVNRYSEQHSSTQQEIHKLLLIHSYIFKVFSFDPPDKNSDLHAKIVVVDRQSSIIGSANLSLRGLKDNYEMGMLIEGETAAEIARKVDQLLTASFVMRITYFQ